MIRVLLYHIIQIDPFCPTNWASYIMFIMNILDTHTRKNIISVLSGLSIAVPSCWFLNGRKRAENTRFKSFILHLSVSVSDYQTLPFIIKGIKKTPSSRPQGNKGSCCHRNKLHRKTSEGVQAFGRVYVSVMVRKKKIGQERERERETPGREC